ncbi:cbb3-type cytochrome c oxidase subunit 3 [Chelativorans sp. Marseille-P2723]|uniref:cbb3-type cytochrome c oxidase subunit 3 n=1 Tax=Chelativorans sp. Marseille-P2723 TaxID=2709133 RepID=UPI0015712927|nr:cbb3-type cytochrome c oxidase subunit 3 [Chelativorans sp. Marseille-P2723]
MEISHETLVGIAKSWGLFYFIAMSIGVLIYTFWPRNRERFARAKLIVLDKEDRPCR